MNTKVMSELMSSHSLHLPVRLRYSDKALLTLAIGFSVALFLTVGQVVLTPRDPLGAISVLTHAHPVLMLLECAGLIAVTAAVGTLLIGSRLPDVGLFCAALGLAIAVIQKDTAAYLLVAADGSSDRSVAMGMAIESVLWSALFLAAILVSGWVMVFCGRSGSAGVGIGGEGSGDTHAAGGDHLLVDRRFSVNDMAAAELGRLSKSMGITPGSGFDFGQMKITLLVAACATLLFAVLASGSSPRIIQHGQTCFALFAAFYLAVWIVKTFGLSPASPLTVLAAAPLSAIFGYVWAMVQPGGAGRFAHLSHIPSSVFLRALPLTYVSVGVIGALIGYWVIADAAPRNTKRDARRTRTATRTR